MERFNKVKDLVTKEVLSNMLNDFEFRVRDRDLNDCDLECDDMCKVIPLAQMITIMNGRKICKKRDFEYADKIIRLMKYLETLETLPIEETTIEMEIDKHNHKIEELRNKLRTMSVSVGQD